MVAGTVVQPRIDASFGRAVIAAIERTPNARIEDILFNVPRPDDFPSYAELFAPAASEEFVDRNSTVLSGPGMAGVSRVPEYNQMLLREQDIPVWPEIDPAAINIHFEWIGDLSAGEQLDALLEIRKRLAADDELNLDPSDIVLVDVVVGCSTWRLRVVEGTIIGVLGTVIGGSLLLALQSPETGQPDPALPHCEKLVEDGRLRSITCYTDAGDLQRAVYLPKVDAKDDGVGALSVGPWEAEVMPLNSIGSTMQWGVKLYGTIIPLQDRRIQLSPFKPGATYQVYGRIRRGDDGVAKPPLVIVTKAVQIQGDGGGRR